MGSTGGVSKKTSVTGTQKKLIKGFKNEFKRGEKGRIASEKEFQKQLGPQGLKFLEKFIGKGNDPYEAITRLFGEKGTAYQTPDAASDLRQGQEIARGVLEPERQLALQQYEREGIPSIVNAFGRGTRGSSALNQALASSRTDLSNQLYAQQNQLGLNVGQNIAQGNAAERARQQGMQYGALSDILGYQNQAAQNYYGIKQNAAQQLSSAGLSSGAQALNKDQFAFVNKGTPVGAAIGLEATKGIAKGAGQAAVTAAGA